MKNFIKSETLLFVAVNAKGEIVNSNDFKKLGPAFALPDTKVRSENGEVVEDYALHIDYNFSKQGAFNILNCSKINAEGLAYRYCKKNNITPIKKLYLYRDNEENLYRVIDINNVEYHFHIARAYFGDGRLRDQYGAYVSIRKEGKITIKEITNINDL